MAAKNKGTVWARRLIMTVLVLGTLVFAGFVYVNTVSKFFSGNADERGLAMMAIVCPIAALGFVVWLVKNRRRP